jgi:glycosyltransferase involved in cell wall biosynthesis
VAILAIEISPDMKVFFTVDALINAGTEKSILDIVSNFSDDIEVKVIYFYPRHDLKESFEKAGITLLFMNLHGKRDFLTGIKKLKKIIESEKPDLVVSSILRANLISRIACRLTKTKLIGTFISDSYSLERQSSFSAKRRAGAWFFSRLDKATASIPYAWISNSASIKQSNCRYLGVDPAKVIVIHRGRDFLKFPEQTRKLPGKMFRFCFVGRLLQTKGLEELVNAFNIVSRKYTSAVLEIYGEGPFRNALSKQITSCELNDKVIMHGNVANGWEKLYDADCFVFPSWYEGFSGSLIEAMMSGIPIIASDIPMNLEAVSDNSTALIHRLRDEKDLAEKMLLMIERYPEMLVMAQRARKIAFEQFDIRVIAARYESFLKQCVLEKEIKITEEKDQMIFS